MQKAIIMSGLVWQEAFCTSNDYNALMCGLYYSFMCQANMMCDSTSLNKLLAKVYQLHATLEPDSITIKYHSFYNHISSHELQYGRKHTSEVFEREHKNLMKSVNHQSTNCEQSIIIRYFSVLYSYVTKTFRYVCAQKCETLLLDKAQELACKEEIFEALKQTKERLPILNSQTNIINIECLIPFHVEIVKHLKLGRDVKFLKRCKVSSSFGNFVFSAPSYCGAKTTVSNLICYTDPLTKSLTFGQIEMIVDNGTCKHLIVKEFILEPMTEIMKSVRRQGISRIAYEVLKQCQSLPPFIGKATDQIQSIVPLENVMCPAIKLEINDATYVLMSK
ncbi:hypothetical protein CRE_07997 [Caenorhabditis remanei]|uniref:Uncharacterized protein n=1 Tax=Caenorhabditis remanei TaxID=31234 RepID=E3M3P9_CAERE|nr:hypothetical protein CRE_07997 [Caenorhabditis remanei]